MIRTSVLVAAILCLTATAASACSCMIFPTPAEQYADADAVFTGHVDDIVIDGYIKYVFMTVHAYWKGDFGATVVIATDFDEAMCGVSFVPGITWLVYAFDTDGWADYYTHLCTRTSDVSWCQEDLDYMGAPLVVSGEADTWGGIKAIYR